MVIIKISVEKLEICDQLNISQKLNALKLINIIGKNTFTLPSFKKEAKMKPAIYSIELSIQLFLLSNSLNLELV